MTATGACAGRLTGEGDVPGAIHEQDHARDGDTTESELLQEATAAKGVTVLENSWTTVRGMVVAGVGDLSRWPHEPQKVLAAAPRKVGTILPAHQPDTFWAYDEPVTLQVSGHTH